MVPRLEEFIGSYKLVDLGSYVIRTRGEGEYETVPDTEHKTGDTESPEAVKAHALLSSDPDNYREVRNELGPKCDIHPTDQVSAEQSVIKLKALLLQPIEEKRFKQSDTKPNVLQRIEKKLFHPRRHV